MSTAQLIPVHDLGDFGKLTDDNKAEVLALGKAMLDIDRAKRTTVTMRAWAGRLRRSYSALRRLYYGETRRVRGVTVRRDGWLQTGWRALVNLTKEAPAARALPVGFIDFWKELCARYQRGQTRQAAHDELLARLKKWERDPRNEALRIPGYDQPPKRDPFTLLPPGWSYGNLLNYKLPGLDNAALKSGRSAALAYRAPLLSTRAGLRVGQYYQFDDQLYDEFVNFLGVNRQLQRVLGLDCIDVATASQPAHAFLPIVWDEAAGKRRGLKQFHADWFLAHVLMTTGYRGDTGTVIVDEHGTMSGSDAFIEAVLRATGDKVTFRRSAIIDNKAHAAMFDGKGGGNFKFKALIEGARVAHRNRASALPAPTGLDPDHAPEEAYYGLQKVSNRVLKLMDKLPPERAQLLAHFAMDFHTFVRSALEIYDLLEDFEDHELEGWMEMNWVVTEWRHALESRDWHPMEELNAVADPVIRDAMKALVTTRPGMLNTRRLSRRAAFERHRQELTCVRGAAVAVMLGPDAARVGRVGEKEPLIAVQDAEFFPQPIHFFAQLRERREMLERGAEYLLYVDPFGCRRAEVHDLKGRHLGSVELWDRPAALDTEARGRQFGLATAAFNDELARNVPRWALPTVEARTAIMEHNVRVASGAAVTAEERDAARDEARRGKSTIDLGMALRESVFGGRAEGGRRKAEEKEEAEDCGAPISHPTQHPTPTLEETC